MLTLNAIWFLLVFVLLGGYVVLDGFDLGVGMLHLLHRDNAGRRVCINAIAPVWDGNEVWLLTAGGALFAAFPAVYATVFSGFYLALMVVLACLIFRAVSIEFRGKVESLAWRNTWDYAFGISSLLLALLFGVAFGNVLLGVPIASDGTYAGTFLSLLNPYALLVGLLSVTALFMHGAIYLMGKIDANDRPRLVRLAGRAWIVATALFVLTTIATGYFAPSLLDGFAHKPIAWCVAALLIGATFAVPVMLKGRNQAGAFVASSAMLAAMMGLGACGLFPRLLPCSNDPSASLTIYNSSSTHPTLVAMLVIALLGMPLVIGYTFVIHRVFRGKVTLTADSY